MSLRPAERPYTRTKNKKGREYKHMDYNQKMKELEALWQDSFDLCQTMIKDCKSGEQRLTGSILKELNTFIKQSVDFLKSRELEAIQEKEDEDGGLSKLDGCVLPDVSDQTEPLGLPEFPPCSEDV